MVTLLCTTLLALGDGIRDAVETAAVIEHCERLWNNDGPHAAFLYICRLGDAGDLRTLRRIYSDDSHLGAHAASIAFRHVRDEDAVAFCKQFKVGSRRWCAVFGGLDERPKAAVMPY